MDETVAATVERELSGLKAAAEVMSAAQKQMAEMCQKGLELSNDRREMHQAALNKKYASLFEIIAPAINSLQSLSERLRQAEQDATDQADASRAEKASAEETHSRYKAKVEQLMSYQEQARERSSQEQTKVDERHSTLARQEAELSSQKADHRVAETNLGAERDALEVERRSFEAKMDAERQALAKEKNVFQEHVDKEKKQLERQRMELERQRADQQATREDLDAKSRAFEKKQAAQANAQAQAQANEQALSVSNEAKRQAVQAERQASGAEFDRLMGELRAQIEAASCSRALANADATANRAENKRLCAQAEILVGRRAAIERDEQVLEQSKASLRDIDEERVRLERVSRELNLRAAVSADLKAEALEERQRLDSATNRLYPQLHGKLDAQSSIISQIRGAQGSSKEPEEWREPLRTAVEELKKEIGAGGAATAEALEKMEGQVQSISSLLASKKDRRQRETDSRQEETDGRQRGPVREMKAVRIPLEQEIPRGGSTTGRKRERDSPPQARPRKRASGDNLGSLSIIRGRPSLIPKAASTADTPLRSQRQDNTGESSGSKPAAHSKGPSDSKTLE